MEGESARVKSKRADSNGKREEEKRAKRKKTVGWDPAGVAREGMVDVTTPREAMEWKDTQRQRRGRQDGRGGGRDWDGKGRLTGGEEPGNREEEEGKEKTIGGM